MSTPNFMPVNKRDTYSSVLKVSLPNRGYILAQHLLETIAIYPFLPKTEILKKLNCIQNYRMIKSSIGHKCLHHKYSNYYFINSNLKNKFIKCVEKKEKLNIPKQKVIPFECSKCKKQITYKNNQVYEILIYDYWRLADLGVLIILTIPQSSLNNFDKVYKKEKILNILDVLEKSKKKPIVDNFIEKLFLKTENIEELEKVYEKLIARVKINILDLKFNKTRHKRLYKLQSEIYNNSIQERVFNAKVNR